MHSNQAQLESDRQSSTVLAFFDMVSEELVELKWLDANNDVEQAEKVVPLFTGEIALRQCIGKLVLCVNICDLDVWVEVDSDK